MSESTESSLSDITWDQEIHRRTLAAILGTLGATDVDATLYELLAHTAPMVSWLREEGFATDDIVIILEALEYAVDIPQNSG